MRILVFACVFGRHSILEVFSAGIDRLREQFDIDVITGTSNDEDYDICCDLGLNPVQVENRPLGRKHNLLLERAFKRDWKRLLLMGSDDLISNTGVQLLLDRDRSHAGFRKMYAVDTKYGGSIIHEYLVNSRLIGAGRMFTRECLENSYTRVDFIPKQQSMRFRADTMYQVSQTVGKHLERRGKGKIKGLYTGIWEEINQNLDNSADSVLTACGYAPYCIESDEVHIIDLKSDNNIHQMPTLHLQEGKVYSAEGWEWFLSEKEKSQIIALQNK